MLRDLRFAVAWKNGSTFERAPTMDYLSFLDRVASTLRRYRLATEGELAAMRDMRPIELMNFLLKKLHDSTQPGSPAYTAVENLLLESIDSFLRGIVFGRRFVVPGILCDDDLIQETLLDLTRGIRSRATRFLSYEYLIRALWFAGQRLARQERRSGPENVSQVSPDIAFEQAEARSFVDRAFVEMWLDLHARPEHTAEPNATAGDPVAKSAQEPEAPDVIDWWNGTNLGRDLMREAHDFIAELLGYSGDIKAVFVDMILFNRQPGWQTRFAERRGVSSAQVTKWKQRFEADLGRYFGREFEL